MHCRSTGPSSRQTQSPNFASQHKPIRQPSIIVMGPSSFPVLNIPPLAPGAAVTPTPTTAAATMTAASGAGLITLAPGFTFTSTIIDGQTYPMFAAGGQGGYRLKATSFSAYNLLVITLANVYSPLPNGQVYPSLVPRACRRNIFSVDPTTSFVDDVVGRRYVSMLLLLAYCLSAVGNVCVMSVETK